MKLWQQYAWSAIVMGILTIAGPVGAPAQDEEPQNKDAERYRRGMIPIAVALIDEMPYPDALAVIIRRTANAPHDIVLLKSSEASGKLLSHALFTLYVVHSQDSACPSQDAVIRVRDQKERRPPLWRDADSRRVERVVQWLRGMPLKNLKEVGQVRMREIWIRRFYNMSTGRLPPGGIQRESIC